MSTNEPASEEEINHNEELSEKSSESRDDQSEDILESDSSAENFFSTGNVSFAFTENSARNVYINIYNQ